VPEPAPDALAVVVVAYQSAEHLPSLGRAVLEQLREDDELVVVDNASTDGSAEVARSLGEAVTVVETGQNLGFAGGCQVGASATRAPLLLFLNPDSTPHANCVAELRLAASRHPEWGAWQAAVLLDDGRINSSGGVIHYSGIGWAGGYGELASALPVSDCPVAFPSGAAMLVRRAAWQTLGGFSEEYFMYGEDLDLGVRLWLCGYGVGLVPSARVGHRYEFEKGSEKWFWLERNRWRTLLSVYPASLLALLAPVLLAAELGLLAVAAGGGWLGAKLRAQIAVAHDLPTTLARRRAVQRRRQISTRDFASHLTSSLDSPYLRAARRPWLRIPQALYWSAVVRALALRAR
jgi:GT2 family glycosyltransferase